MGRERRLTIDDMAMLRPGDQLIYVIPTAHKKMRNVAQGCAQQQSSSAGGHFFERDGDEIIQAEAQVLTNPKGPQLVSGVIGDKEALQMFDQGIGITLQVFGEKASTEVPARDVFNGTIELWDLNPNDEPLRNYAACFGSKYTRRIGGSEAVLKQLLFEVSGGTRHARH